MGGLILLLLGGLGAILMSSKKRQGASPANRPAGAASAAPTAYQHVAQTSVEPSSSFTMTPDKIALYRQSIANTTDPAVLTELAGTFDMAGLSGLAKEARDRAASLRQSPAAVTPEKIAVYRQSIANTTDPTQLEQLAGTFDMAGLSDLSKEARERARVLRAKGSQAQVAGVAAVPSPLVQTGDTIRLAPGVTYRARLALGFIQSLASREQIAEVFSKLGFASVRVFADASELPADWLPEYREPKGAAGRWVEGTWNDAPRALARPEDIDAVWDVPRAPAATAAGAVRDWENSSCRSYFLG